MSAPYLNSLAMFGGYVPFGLSSMNTFIYSQPPSVFAYQPYNRAFVDNIISILTSFRAPVMPFSYNLVKRGNNNRVYKNCNASSLKSIGYSAQKGMALARSALNSAVGFVKKCATYVKNAIVRTGLGAYMNGHGYQMASILRRNKNFKEISPVGVNVKSLPAGCILVYGKGVAGYSSKYGHTEITTGDGRCVSDGITRNPRNNPTAIFVPVA